MASITETGFASILKPGRLRRYFRLLRRLYRRFRLLRETARHLANPELRRELDAIQALMRWGC